MQARVTLREFAALLQPYRESIQAASDLLSDLSTRHQDGSVFTVQERVDLLRTLAALGKVYEDCRVVSGETNAVPLALVPERLPLLKALIEAKAQTQALARRFAALELSPTRRDMSTWWETEQAIGDMRRKNEAVADEARHLLERARFRERADRTAPRQPRPLSQQPRKRGH